MQNLGSVTASIYFKPKKDGKSKIVLQGSAYMSFLTFVIPEVLKDLNAEVTKGKIENTPALTVSNDQNDETKTTKNKDVDEAADTAIAKEIKILVTSFERLEVEVVGMRERLVKAVDESKTQMINSLESTSVKKELETLEKVVAANSKEISSLNVKVDKVIENQERFKVFNSDNLQKFISDSKTVFTKLGDISSIHTAANDFNESVENNKRAVEGFVRDSKSIIEQLIEV